MTNEEIYAGLELLDQDPRNGNRLYKHIGTNTKQWCKNIDDVKYFYHFGSIQKLLAD